MPFAPRGLGVVVLANHNVIGALTVPTFERHHRNSHSFDRREIQQFAEVIAGKPLTALQQMRFETEWRRLTDPRHGYYVIDTLRSAEFWLTQGDYDIALFAGGYGIISKKSGGCWGYFDDALLDKMVEAGMIAESGRNGPYPHYVVTLADYMARSA